MFSPTVSNSWAFSAEISSCFMFSPTVSNSCSTSFNFCSANSARSLALLSRDFKLLHVFTYGFQFLLNILQLLFSQLSTLIGPLELILLDTQFPGQFIKLLLIVAGHLRGLPQVLVSLLNLNFVPHGLVLQVFDFLQDTISFLGSHGQFGNGLSQIAVSLLGFLLHQHDSPGQGANFLLSVLESLFLLLKGSEGFDKLVIGLIKVTLVVLDLLAHVTNVTFISITLTIGLFGFSLKFGNGGHEIVSLRLERLHLFPNGIHVCS